MRRRVSNAYLFLASIFTFLTFYIFYIWFRQTHFHPTIDTSLFIPSKRYEFNPEIEIQLYLTGFVLFILTTPIIFYIYRKLLRRFSESLKEEASRVFLLIMFMLNGAVFYLSLNIGKFGSTKIIFLAYLASFSLSVMISLYRPDKFLKPINFINDILARLLKRIKEFIFPIIRYVTNLKIPFQLKKISINSKLYYGVDILVLTIIFSLVARVNRISPNDYNYFLGPINDVLGGKTLLLNSPSQYGLLLIYFLAFIFKFLIPLTYNNFFWLQFTLTSLGYFLLYLILKKWLKGLLFPIFGILFIIQQNYFHQIANILFLPQVGFLRFGWWIILLAFLIYQDEISLNQRIKKIIELTIVGTSFFWSFDGGIYVLGAYLFFIIIQELLIHKNIWKSTTSILKQFLRLVFTLFIFSAGMSLFTLTRTGSLPNWPVFFGDTILYTGGFGMIPMPTMGPYLIFIIVYALLLSFVIYKTLLSGKMPNADKQNLPILSFVIVYGILQFTYYVGRSHPNNLHHVVIPLVLLILLALNKWLESFPNKGSSLALLVVTFFSLIILKDFLGLWSINSQTNNLLPNFDEISQQPQLQNSITALNDYFNSSHNGRKKVALISQKDTFFLIKTKSINAIDSNNLSYFILIPQLKKLGRQLLNNHPDKIFIDHQGSDQVDILKNYIIKDYHYDTNVGYLDIWSRNL